VDEVVASFHRRPDAAATLDGLNISPVDTAKLILAKAKEEKLDDLATRLDTELGKLDQAMLEPPAYETGGRGGARRGGRRGRRGG
jgi:hypothetical protein